MTPLNSSNAFRLRQEAFLRFIIANSHNPEETIWGPYRLVDGYALAHLALEQDLPRAHQLIEETLSLIRVDVEQERQSPKMKWHLSDFALHPVLRAYFLYSDKFFNGPKDGLWTSVSETLRRFMYHFGDLTENHNLLHLSLRYLASQTWPEATFSDGRLARVHLNEAREGLLSWMDSWITRGSAEWGSEIYYNMNLLALLNLHEFARDETVRRVATGLLDLILLDEALDAFAGCFVGASHRSYGAYRVDAGESPSRGFHFLYFGMNGDQLNLNFIGAVIEAATSRYRPPQIVSKIAADRIRSFVTHTTHIVNIWANTTHLSKTTLRTPDVVLSTMNSPGSPHRYTEQVWQATLGPRTLVFSNHPTLHRRAFSNHSGTPQDILTAYENIPPSGPHPYWVVGNVPLGHYGDTRPGFWQGNSWGPRSYGEGPLAFLIYKIPSGDPLPWIHLFFPRLTFDEVREENSWIFGRKGDGFVGVWVPEGYQWTTRGVWADVEVRSLRPRNAILAYVGRAKIQGNFDGFIASTTKIDPKWNADSLTLSARSVADGALLNVSYRNGPYRNGKPIRTKFARFETPWGSMPLGSRQLVLERDGHRYELDLRDLLAPTALRLAGYYRSQMAKQFFQRQWYVLIEPVIRMVRPWRANWEIHRPIR
jgi:hypothetical protein